ncbi:transposase [Ilumatobacter sp.]|uniref:transposase n=1 Tax=Ilumatobacter sp. TaxID=1967498 RepID=UPI003C4AA694
MGRMLRADSPGDWHHVMNRGSGRRRVFWSDDERAAFVDLLSELDDRFGVEIHAYCLMGNHYHLLVRSASGRLSEAMCWLGSRFTRLVNWQRGVDGAIFRGRFHAVAVQREPHLVWLFRYINANPIDLGWQQPLAEYPWSGLAASLGMAAGSPDWVRTDAVTSFFGRDPGRLERFVEQARDPGRLNQERLIDDVVQEDIMDALQTARLAGPAVNTETEVRAAHTHLAIEAGVAAHHIDTVVHLEPESAARSIERARRRCSGIGPTHDLVARAKSILAFERDLDARTAGA